MVTWVLLGNFNLDFTSKSKQLYFFSKSFEALKLADLVSHKIWVAAFLTASSLLASGSRKANFLLLLLLFLPVAKAQKLQLHNVMQYLWIDAILIYWIYWTVAKAQKSYSTVWKRQVSVKSQLNNCFEVSKLSNLFKSLPKLCSFSKPMMNLAKNKSN